MTKPLPIGERHVVRTGAANTVDRRVRGQTCHDPLLHTALIARDRACGSGALLGAANHRAGTASAIP